MKPDISIIIVAYRNKEKLKITLDAVFASQMPYSYEVIVVDNDSRDGTAEMIERDYAQVKLVRTENKGFAAGNNRGYELAQGDTILLLNPDTAVSENAIGECAKFLQEHPDVGIVGCKLVKEDGTLDLACRRNIPDLASAFFRFTRLSFLFPRSKFFSGYNLTNTSEDQSMEVGSVSGAFMMTRREVIQKMNNVLFDEDYFMYSEDVDTCLRCKKAGYKVWYYPAVTTIHYKGQSSKKASSKSLYWFHKYMWVFYRKHYLDKYPFFVNWLVWFGIWLRFGVLYVINKFRSEPYVSK